MRAGVLISAISHVLLVLLALLGTPKLIDGTVPPITVDLVRADEVPEVPQDPPKPEKEKPAPGTCRPSRARSAAIRSARPAQRHSHGPGQQPPGRGSSRRRRIRVRRGTRLPKPSIFDPAAIPMLLDLPNSQGRNFDAESTTVANLSDDERAAFRARLRKCWKLPGGTSQTTRVVLRIYLRRDARLRPIRS